MRVVFMGSPAFAVPTLRRLIRQHQVVGVVCQPDRRAGRGRQPRVQPAKRVALEHQLPVLQPARLREPESLAPIRALEPELIVVAAYGQILPHELLELPAHGSLNVHASLLPRWRGASPIQAALLAGDPETGVTIMLMDAGLDTGPILSQRSTPIPAESTAGSLSAKLADLGAELLIDTIPGYLAGELRPQPQDDRLATSAPLLKKTDGELRFDQPAERLARQVRAYDPWPGSFTSWRVQRLAVKRAHANGRNDLPPGLVDSIDAAPAVGTADGALVLDQVQLAGRRETSGADFLRGAPGFLGARLPS